ncbi:DUF1080 domain-containing protein [Haloferula sp. A504]|uniref:DUF1080 domain-containing protein n=1 Tax=Haloferula sp. A504 TaxID=3373601 RepID=UPI0031C03C35|nr:DUF1080 domain-containing protein [Verrucomicrobiaceae bacterium E54]
MKASLTNILPCLLFLVGPLQGEEPEWIDLFDGKTLEGWSKTGGDAVFEAADGTITGSGAKKTTFLVTKEDYGDFELVFEYKLHDLDLNSGVQFRSERTPSRERVNTLKGPQIELTKSPGRSGLIFRQGGGAWITPEDKLVRNNAAKNGEWNTVKLRVEGPRIQTWINGILINDSVSEEDHKRYPSGAIGLQVHGIRDYDGTPRRVSWRGIRLKKL